MKYSLKVFDDGIRELNVRINNLNTKILEVKNQVEGLKYAKYMMETLRDNLIEDITDHKDEENKN